LTTVNIYLVAVAGMKATAVYSYDADQDDELSLEVGDVIYVIAQVTSLTYLFIFVVTSLLT